MFLVSLPKLEFSGAVLVSDLVDSVVPHSGIDNYTLYFWSDFTIVLSWLRKPSTYNLATKVIHLEAVSDLTSNAFLAAFSRFVSRRGYPSNVYSDNGKNFVGAAKIIAQDFLKAAKSRTEAT